MSKLAHSNQKTMDWIDFKAAIENGNEDMIFDELQQMRGRTVDWDNYYNNLPSDLKRRLSFHDFRRLGKVFQTALT